MSKNVIVRCEVKPDAADDAPKLIVVAHNVRSMANVGALFRTCDGAGVSELVLSGYTGTPPDRRIAKVALGAEEAVAWRSVPELEQLTELFAGKYVIVLEQHADAVPMHELKVNLPADKDIVLVACEELLGADQAMVARADALLELPMRGVKQSLNVAMAAGIAMYSIADLLWGTPLTDLTSRHQRVPVREGVLTLGVTAGETPTRHLQ